MIILLKELLQNDTFYRGENDSGLKIKDPLQHAKDIGGIFVSKSEKHARLYGDRITKFSAKPGVKILSFEDYSFWKLIGRRMPPNKFLGSVLKKGESLVDMVNFIVDKAKNMQYDAVVFSNTDDIGTVILNPNMFTKQLI